MKKLLIVATLGLAIVSPFAIGSLQVERRVQASSHREAPSTAVDPMADGTDVYAFVDPTDPTRVNLITNFIPFQLPQGGPNFYRFDDNILYEIKIDNDGDAIDDISIQWRFRTVVGNVNTFLYNTGPVATLNSPNLNIKQFYSVTVMRGTSAEVLTPTGGAAAGSPAGFPFAVPPVNVGPRSTPNYETALAQPAIATATSTRGAVTLFAGQRDEGFYIDVASIFDLLGLRPFNSAHVAPLPNAPGVDATAGFNVSTLAVQVPISAVTKTGALPTGAGDPNAVIGVYSTSSRRALIAFAEDRSGNVTFSGNFVQTSRLGNPLINETVIPLGMKDRFNASLPSGDGQFLGFVLDPEPGKLIGYAGSPPAFDLYPSFNAPAPPRNDVATIFLTGIPALNVQTNTSGGASPTVFAGQPANTVANERLRLNLAIAPTGPANAQGTPNRLGFLGGDNAGFPNGRRVGDDVVDIELRVFAGATSFTPAFNVAPNNLLGDGVNTNDRPYLTRFPYLATPWAGYDAPTSQDARAVGSTDTAVTLPTPRPEPTPRP